MEGKPKRRTRERIVETALSLFNQFGAPNVTTTVIADELEISPGNLYYHFSNKDEIVNTILAAFEREIEGTLAAPAGFEGRPLTVEDIWLFLHLLFEIIWKYRFFYRDLSDLVSENRTLEMHFKQILAHKIATARRLCEGLARAGDMKANAREMEALSANMVLVATYWLSFEFARNPRQAQDDASLSRGVYHAMAMVAPFLKKDSRALFEKLAQEYV
ncbi:MAG: TetR family transcriptional regulator [Betaproteobacteria bacterium]|nr:TetR family transcriptional regulator [Betaproteobacteria bacterium]